MMLRTKRGLRGETRSSRVYSRLTRRQPFLRPAPQVMGKPSELQRNPQFVERHSPNDATNDDARAFDVLISQGRPEDYEIFPVTILKRTVSLTSDAIVLTLASPFFAVWWLYRAAKRMGIQK